jgi:autotransporter-associated beta strand protein
MSRFLSVRLLVAAVILLGFRASVRGQNTALVWSGAGNTANWSNTGNWNFFSSGTPAGVYPNNGQPGAGNTYDVSLSGSPTLDTNITINNFTFISGVVSGGSNLTVQQVFTWSGGLLGGSGTVTLNGGAAIGASGVSSSVYAAQPIVNASGSTATITGPSNLFSNTGATWTNQSSSTFTFGDDSGLAINTGTGTFTNSGGAIFQKTGGTNTSAVAWNFTNSGTINATSGTISFTGTNTQSGPITVGTGANVSFAGGTSTWTAGAGATGAGNILLTSGSVLFNSTNTLVTPVTLSGATVDGTGAMTISGLLTWSGGNLGDPAAPLTGTTKLSGGAAITGTVALNRTVTNAGTTTKIVNVSAPINIYSNSTSAKWTDMAGSVFDFTADASLAINAGTGTFTNSSGATFEKTGGSGVSTIAWTFVNNGTMKDTTGTLSFTGTNTQNGSMSVSAGANVQFNGGTSTWTNAASSAGAGNLLLTSGTVLFNGSNTLSTPVTLSGATVDGSGTMNIVGLLTWLGGNLGAPSSPGAGTTTLTGGAVIGVGSVYLNRAVNNASGSTVTIAGPYTLFANAANPTWTNLTGSVFNFAGDGSLGINAGAGTFVNNSGATFEMTAASGASIVNWAFTNSGTVLASSGTLSFPNSITLTNFASATLTGGTWRVLSGATLDLGSTRTITTIAAGTTVEVNGPGSVFANVENSVVNVAGTLNIFGARAFTPGGTIIDTGSVSVGQANGSGSQFNSAVMVNNGGLLQGSGTVTGAVTVATGGTVSSSGFSFTIASLAGSGAVNNNATAAGSLTLGADNTSTTFSGTIVDGTVGTNPAGAFSLVKVGTGTLTLTGTSNTYSGGTNIQNGTIVVASDAALGTGNVTGASLGSLSYTGSTTTTRSFSMNGGTITVAAGQTLTFNGSQVSSVFLDGAGSYATSAVNGATFSSVTTLPSVTLTSNSGNDQLVNLLNGGALKVAAGVSAGSKVTFYALTNLGSGSITLGANSKVNVSNFQSYGVINIAYSGTHGVATTLTNTGTAPLSFGSGSRTFLGPIPSTIPPIVILDTTQATLDLNGVNAIVVGGLFQNNGLVKDSSGTGATIFAEYGSLVKGAGMYQNPVVTPPGNQGTFQPGNSPGAATFGRFVFGPGGVSNYLMDINNATGQAGPTPDASNNVSGWGLVKTSKFVGGATSGNFAWTADPSDPITVSLETLVNPTAVGTEPTGLMANFDPTKAYSWEAVAWVGAYSGPTDAATLDASTVFNTSEFANPIAGTFGWNLDPTAGTLSLTYTPSAVPEPGTLCLTGLSGLGIGWLARRRRRAGNRGYSVLES